MMIMRNIYLFCSALVHLRRIPTAPLGTTEDGSDYLYPDTHSFEKNGRIVTVAEYFRVLHEDHAATPV